MSERQQRWEQDQQVRAEVLDPQRSFIVQAPAGSGKTELLTQRLLTLLGRVNDPEEVLAITFTRKAAGEMRVRLLDSLRRAQSEPCPQEAHLAVNWKLARTVLAQDRRQGWQLLSQPNRLEIRTLDSLNARLIRQLPLLAALGGMPQVSDDASRLYREAARATLQLVEDETLGGPLLTLLRWLDNRAATVERLIQGMLGQRDQWLPHVAGGRLDRDSLEQALQEVVESLLEQCRNGIEQALGPQGVASLVSLAAEAAEVVSTQDAPAAVIACAGLQQLPEATADALPQWQGLASMLLKSDGGFRLSLRSWTVKSGFPAGAEGKLKKEALLALSEKLSQHPVARLIQQLPLLPPVTYEEQQWAVVEALFQVLLLAQAHLMMVFEQRGVCDHTEIAQRAQRALGSEEAPTSLALRLDYQIHHILVDEFQDTSHGQFSLLQRLTAEWMPEDGRTLFLVGDPMQSIYRFRHAEVGLFIKAIEEGMGNLTLHYRQLSANFRSESGVVEWVNQAFAQIFPRNSNRFTGAVQYASALAVHEATTTASVTIHPQLEEDRQAEAATVVQLVEAALGEIDEDGKVAILVRSRTHLQQITQALFEQGVRYRAVEIEALGDRPLVRDLMSLLRALLHPADREAWLALLRAPWCGLSLQSLLLLTGAGKEQTVWQLMQDEARLQRLPDEERWRVVWLSQQMEKLLQQRGALPLVRWLQQGWRLLGGEALYRNWLSVDEMARESVALFELISQMEQQGPLIDLQQLQQRLAQQNLRSDAQSSARVELMTIHKSKGLQFDTVILPGLGRRPRGNDSQLLQWFEVPQAQGGEGAMQLLLSPVRAAHQSADEDPLGGYLRKLEQQQAQNELGRLLYVAITRAERCVHLLGAVGLTTQGGLKRPGANTLLEQLWPQVEEAYVTALEQIEGVEEEEAEPEELCATPALKVAHLYQLPQPPVPTIPLPEASAHEGVYQWGGSRAIHIGTVVHAQLQWVSESGVEQWGDAACAALQLRAAHQLRQLGVLDDGATARVVEAVQQVLDDPQGRYFLQPHAEAKSEWSLSAQLDGVLTHITIDRTFVDEQGVRWIVDWKSSSHSGGGLEAFLDEEVLRYTPQLQRYGEVLRLLEDRPQKLVLYFPMHQVVREVIGS